MYKYVEINFKRDKILNVARECKKSRISTEKLKI